MIFTNLLVGGSIPEVKRMGTTRVFVTLQGDDIFLDSLPIQFRTKAVELMQALVPHIDGFLIHSQDYADRMASLLEIPTGKIHVVPLGINTADFQKSGRAVSPPESFSIGYLARMAPEKGLHRLVDAFIAIAHRPEAKHVKLKLAGWMGPQHTEFWNEQKAKLNRSDLSDRWEYLGSIDREEKASFLNSIDLFCVPTTYTEPKGLFLLEAIAAGVPYVQPDHGAFPELHRRVLAIDQGGRFGTLFQADSMDDLTTKLLESIQSNTRLENVSQKVLGKIDIQKHAERVLACLAPN